MTTTRITVTVDVLDHGGDFTAGMIVGLLRGSGLTITGWVVDDEMVMSDAEVDTFEQWRQATEPAPPAEATAPPTPAAEPGSQHGRRGRPPTYTDADKERALALYREQGLTAAVRAGTWSRAAVQRWVKEARDAGLLTIAAHPTGVAPRSRAGLTPGAARLTMLRHLVDHDGAVEDAEGRLVRHLADQLGYTVPASVSNLLVEMEKAGLIVRRVVGKRTYAAQITGKGREFLDDAERPAQAAVAVPEPEPAPITRDPAPETQETAEDATERKFEERLARRRPPERRNFGTQPKPEGPRPAFPTVGPIERRPFDPDAVRYATAENAYADPSL